MKIETLKLKWRPLTGMPTSDAQKLSDRLDAVLRSWEGTPYFPGQRCKGAGADCVRFVCGVLDEVYGFEPQPIETLPPDAAMHDRAGAVATMKKIRELYPSYAVEDGSLEPADVIVVGPHDGGPGHAMICGARPNTLWHAAGKFVHWTGLGLIAEHQTIFRVYRLNDRERGAR